MATIFPLAHLRRVYCAGPLFNEAERREMLRIAEVLSRADFEPFAREVLVVVAPGPAKADPTMFEWSRLRKGLRLKPLGPAFGDIASA